jgi:hypothetical protein
MAAIIHGPNLVFSITDAKPPRGFPEGKLRFKLRINEFAQAFVKTDTGIRRFYVEEVDGFWEPFLEQGANHRS